MIIRLQYRVQLSICSTRPLFHKYLVFMKFFIFRESSPLKLKTKAMHTFYFVHNVHLVNPSQLLCTWDTTKAIHVLFLLQLPQTAVSSSIEYTSRH